MASFFAEVRALHILVAAAWFGAAAFLTLYLMPALGQLGAQGAPVLRALDGRRFHLFMAANAGLTVLSGAWLYWTLTAGFSPQVMASRSGMVFGIGGLAGLVAAVVGATLVGGSAKRLAALAAGGTPEPETVAVLQRRIRTGSRFALALMFLALLAMTMGHAA